MNTFSSNLSSVGQCTCFNYFVYALSLHLQFKTQVPHWAILVQQPAAVTATHLNAMINTKSYLIISLGSILK